MFNKRKPSQPNSYDPAAARPQSGGFPMRDVVGRIMDARQQLGQPAPQHAMQQQVSQQAAQMQQGLQQPAQDAMRRQMLAQILASHPFQNPSLDMSRQAQYNQMGG